MKDNNVNKKSSGVKWSIANFVLQCIILLLLTVIVNTTEFMLCELKSPDPEPTAEITQTVVQNEVGEPVLLEAEKEPYFYLSDSERHVVECIVMGEAGNQIYEGQLAVAQCILNACIQDNLQPSEVRVKYQYAGWNENPSKTVVNAVKQVFDDGYKLIEENVLWFYNPEICSSSFHESQTLVAVIQDHRFFAPAV